MERIAEDVHLLPSRPRYAFNSYLVGDVLVDAGTRFARRRILRALGGRRVGAHLITHAHSDHQGSSAALCGELGVPCWAPAAEADALESGDLASCSTDNAITRLQRRHWAGPALRVDRHLREGDDAGSGFVVLEVPGHSPGMLALWRESDRVVIAADVLFGRHPLSGRPGLHEPPAAFTRDPERNREQIRRLAALEPAVWCFGHGRPWRDTAAVLRFAERL